MTVVVIFSCKVFKKVLLESFPTKIGKIKRHFFWKNVNDKKRYISNFCAAACLNYCMQHFLIINFFH